MDTTAREFLTKGVVGVKKKKAKENIQKCREILERAKIKHTNQKQTNPEASI